MTAYLVPDSVLSHYRNVKNMFSAIVSHWADVLIFFVCTEAAENVFLLFLPSK